jgi:hypothetical protein
LTFYYSGNTSQPGIQQIQPLRTNEDPLNITIGNPGLKPQFNNEMALYYNDYKVFTERSIWANLSYTSTENAISSLTTVDAAGKRVTQFINVNGNHSYRAYIDYSFKWKKPGLRIGFNGNMDQNRNLSIVNTKLNTTNSGNYTAGFNISKAVENKFEIRLWSSATYTASRSSVNTGIRTDYWTYAIRPELDIYLPVKFQFHSDCDINLRQKINAFDKNLNTVLLNAWFGKKFLKKDVLLLKVSANDLLDQNISFNRTVNSNFISQNTISTIKRYFMLSVVWNFTKAGTPAPRQ